MFVFRPAFAEKLNIPPSRIEEVTATLRDPATWFVVAGDGPTLVGMASAMPARHDLGAGPVIPGACYLDLLFVVPERWGQGIGGVILDAVLDEARGRDYASIQLWTHENKNARIGSFEAAASRQPG